MNYIQNCLIMNSVFKEARRVIVLFIILPPQLIAKLEKIVICINYIFYAFLNLLITSFDLLFNIRRVLL